MQKKVMLGMSGGVDSAMSAHLLKISGYDVTAANCCFYKSNNESEKSVEDAAKAAEKLQLPFEVFDLRKPFYDKVIKNFIETYKKGGTPNPCIVCNKNLKFGAMLELALEKGFDYIATGHYARIEKDQNSGRYLLKKGADPSKDQSYVLYCLTQHQLAHTLFPLGELTKEEVKTRNNEMKIVRDKGESQDICFVPDGDYAAFIEKETGHNFPEGDFIAEDGRILGTHKGIIRYTVGQRKGLGLALPAPMYVKEKDTENNRVILCDNETLFTKELYATDINLIPFDSIEAPIRVKAKVRYKHREEWATATMEGGLLHIIFDEPQRAIAKGQAVVMYDGDYVVGGGTII